MEIHIDKYLADQLDKDNIPLYQVQSIVNSLVDDIIVDKFDSIITKTNIWKIHKE